MSSILIGGNCFWGFLPCFCVDMSRYRCFGVSREGARACKWASRKNSYVRIPQTLQKNSHVRISQTFYDRIHIWGYLKWISRERIHIWGYPRTLRFSNLPCSARCLILCFHFHRIYVTDNRWYTANSVGQRHQMEWCYERKRIFRLWLRWYQRLWYFESIFTPARYMIMYLRDKYSSQWIRLRWAVG